MICSNSSSCFNQDPCLFGYCVCPKDYTFNKQDDIRHTSLILPMIGAILYDIPSLSNVYCFIFILMASFGFINNIFSLMTFMRDRIRNTICGFYLILYSICSLILMILILTNVITAMYYDKYIFRLWTCYGYPYLSLLMVYTSILISSAIAIESMLHICFKFDKFRSGKGTLIISLLFLFIVSISNLDKIFGRDLIIDQSGYFYCTYKKNSYELWSIVLLYIYMIIPWFIHLIYIILIIFIIIKEKYFHKIIIHRSYIIPSLLFIFCMVLNVSYLYLYYFCLTYSSNYINRLHVSFIFLLYTPQIFTYMIYVLPNRSYMKEFYQIWFYKKLCCYFYNRKRHIQEFEVIHNLWHRKTSLETTKTITSLNDMYVNSEFYKKIKMEV